MQGLYPSSGDGHLHQDSEFGGCLESKDSSKRKLTLLIHIISTRIYLLGVVHTPDARLFTHGPKALRENDQLVAWKIVFLDRLADENLRSTVGVDIGRIPGIQTTIVGCF